MSSPVPMIRTRLSAMMFLQFFLWASWYVPVGGYANGALGFTGPQIGWLYASTALGAIISPMFVGLIADRFFATERVLAVLHLIGGGCLLAASQQRDFWPLMILLLVNALAFMPTLGLTNSLAFRNIDDPNRFSRIAVWGTIGWIVSGLLVDFALGGLKPGSFFFLAGGGGIAMAIYSLTLPHTPPKGGDGGDVLGLRALQLLKDPSFLVFAVCAFLISIPLTFYFQWGNAFLTETDRPKPTALMTLCQVSEIVVMIIMPWFIGRIGLKNVLVIGMGAWAIRYILFASLSFPLIILGLLVHGFCYCFVFVASFIYVSKKAPPEMSASAQSLVALLMWGVGMFVGTQLAGWTGQEYPPAVTITALKNGEKQPDQLLPPWKTEQGDGLAKALGAAEKDSVSVSAIDALPESGFKLGELSYSKDEVRAAATKADKNNDGTLTYEEWQGVRPHNWPPIWLWPGALAAVVCVLFLLGGRDAGEPIKSEG